MFSCEANITMISVQKGGSTNKILQKIIIRTKEESSSLRGKNVTKQKLKDILEKGSSCLYKVH